MKIILSVNDYYTHFREFNTEIARWWQVDPLASKYPSHSPYVSMGNNPVLYTDVLGDDWFVNKETGNVVFIKGASEMNLSNYGKPEQWENLGKDDMFNKNGKEYTKNTALIYMENKSAEMFMNAQGYEKGEKTLIVRTTYSTLDYENGGNMIQGVQISETPLSKPSITYVTPDKFKQEVVIDKGKSKVWVPVFARYRTELVIKTSPIKNENDLKENNNAFGQFLKQLGEKIAKSFTHTKK